MQYRTATLGNINGSMCQFTNKLNYFGILRKKALFFTRKVKKRQISVLVCQVRNWAFSY